MAVVLRSEKELAREMEKVIPELSADQNWSHRIAAMRRIEAFLLGGAFKFPCAKDILRQLQDPLSIQILDRRSMIVKQVCHLLTCLSAELEGALEQMAEALIPVLLKQVVITVQVMAEAADQCIRQLFVNCRVARLIPKIADLARNDRSHVLRERCAEYLVLVLEIWSSSQEVQRHRDVFQAFIKAAVGDALSEVRATARRCFSLFAEIWPEKANKLLLSVDSSTRKLIKAEGSSLGPKQEKHIQQQVNATSTAEMDNTHQLLASPFVPAATSLVREENTRHKSHSGAVRVAAGQPLAPDKARMLLIPSASVTLSTSKGQGPFGARQLVQQESAQSQSVPGNHEHHGIGSPATHIALAHSRPPPGTAKEAGPVVGARRVPRLPVSHPQATSQPEGAKGATTPSAATRSERISLPGGSNEAESPGLEQWAQSNQESAPCKSRAADEVFTCESEADGRSNGNSTESAYPLHGAGKHTEVPLAEEVRNGLQLCAQELSDMLQRALADVAKTKHNKEECHLLHLELQKLASETEKWRQ